MVSTAAADYSTPLCASSTNLTIAEISHIKELVSSHYQVNNETAAKINNIFDQKSEHKMLDDKVNICFSPGKCNEALNRNNLYLRCFEERDA